MQKILRILLLRPENSARGLQEIARDFQRIPGRAARADPSVRRRRRLAERALHAPAPTPQSLSGGPVTRPRILQGPACERLTPPGGVIEWCVRRVVCAIKKVTRMPP